MSETGHEPTETQDLATAHFQFYSVVDISCIPLALCIGPLLDVNTSTTEANLWFRDVLQSHLTLKESYEHRHHPERLCVGILTGPVDGLCGKALLGTACVSEVLFFAVRAHIGDAGYAKSASLSSDRPVKYQLKAVRLCSDILDASAASQLTLPTSPSNTALPGYGQDHGQYLEPAWSNHAATLIGTKKRKTALDAFDDATDRLTSKRREQCRAIRATSPSHLDPSAQQTKPLQRSFSASLSQVREQTPTLFTAQPDSKLRNETETRNRDTVSRLIMAGMRLYGLSRDSSSTAGHTQIDNDGSNDEYKAVYHATLKAVVFAYRKIIAQEPLQSQMAALQATVDQLLLLFCTGPHGCT